MGFPNRKRPVNTTNRPGTKSLASREIEIFGCQGLGLVFSLKAMDIEFFYKRIPYLGTPGVHHKDQSLHLLHGKNRALLKIERYIRSSLLVMVSGSSYFLGLFQVIMANPVP